jgi:hypothetical protein
MRALDQLGMEENWIYEVIISSVGDNGPHVAPFGVKTRDFNCVEIEIYKGSNTLRNILVNGEFAVNMVVDPVIFYNALFANDKIKYSLAKRINTPVLFGSPASIEARLIDTIDTKQKILIKAKVVHLHLHSKSEWLNRAKNILLESLILSTRIAYFPEGKAEKLLRENYRVVQKVAPRSEYELIMQELLRKCFG